MELPVAVRQVLADKAPQLDLSRVASYPQGERLRLVVLQDSEGKLQALFRQADLLDIASLNSALGRDLKVMPLREQARLRERIGLQLMPGLPLLTGLPTVIDERVFQAATVSLSLGMPDSWLTLDAAALNDLTGQATRHGVTVAGDSITVNHNQPEQDRAQLDSALKRFTGLRIQQRLDDTLELPPLPETAQRIIHLRVNPNAVMGDLVDIVESDPSLAAQVVSWASSSFYAAAGQVRSVHDAVSRVLGFELVMNLAMGLALGRTLKQPSDQPEGFVGYWQQAIWQAQSAGILASMMRRGQRPAFGLAYLAGLLHNFGYLVLAQIFPPHFKLACRYWEANTHLDSSVVEQHLLGVTREQIGAQLMDNWGMPEEITAALRQQKNPHYEGEHQVYARLLWLGRQLLTQRGIPLGGQVHGIDDGVFEELGLDRRQVEEQFDDLVHNRDSIMAMAGIMSSSHPQG